MKSDVETTLPTPDPTSDASVRSRRRLLRLVAGGVPMMAGPPAMAGLAASSAFRAAVNDGKAPLPSLVAVTAGDRWIRQPVEVVRLGPGGINSGPTATDAYKVVITGQPTRYFSTITPFPLITLGTGSPPLAECTSVVATQTWMLVLFDRDNFSMIPQVVDPTLYGSSSLQGLHCSSWSSISPNAGRPLSCSGV
jgi:hypothetical protein